MLCITRRDGESLRIGGAKITVVVSGKRAKLLIDAPKEIRILREELAVRDEAEAYHRDHCPGDFDDPGF